MKPRYSIIAAAVLVVAVAFLLRPKPEIPPAPKVAVITTTADGMSLATHTDPALVFKKAFWRHPTSDDNILHAERREWSAEDGVRKWQWFIAVEPGPKLLDWLETNPFSLATTRSVGEFERQPDWFPEPSADFHIQQNAEGRLTLMLSADRKLLYATDSGVGFTPPVVTP